MVTAHFLHCFTVACMAGMIAVFICGFINLERRDQSSKDFMTWNILAGFCAWFMVLVITYHETHW